MSEFEINIEGNFLKQIPGMKKDLEKSAQSALRKTANQTDKEIHRLVTVNNLIDISLNDFLKSKKTRTVLRINDLKGGIEDMNINILITSKAHTSFRFMPRSIGPAKKKVWIGRIYGRASKFYGGQAFSLKGKKPLFVRESTYRFPLKPVFGPTVPDMMDKTGLTSKVVAFTEANLRDNLLKSIGDELDI